MTRSGSTSREGYNRAMPAGARSFSERWPPIAILESPPDGHRIRSELVRSLDGQGLSVQVLLRRVRQRLHVLLPGVRHWDRLLGSADGGQSLRRRLRKDRLEFLRSPARHRRPRPRQGARGRGHGDEAEVQAVQPVRQVDMRGGLLESRAEPLRAVRAQSRRGDRVGAGRGGQAADVREGTGGGLAEGSRHRPQAGRDLSFPAERTRKAGSSVPPAAPTSRRPRRAASAEQRSRDIRSSAPSATARLADLEGATALVGGRHFQGKTFRPIDLPASAIRRS